ncbi:MAG: sensor histidine kinase, partial [Clostridia bacterium]
DVAFCTTNDVLKSVRIATNELMPQQLIRASDYLGKDFYDEMCNYRLPQRWFSRSVFTIPQDVRGITSFDDSIALCRRITDINTGSVIGLMIWHIRGDTITQRYREAAGEDGLFLVVDDTGRIVNPNGVFENATMLVGDISNHLAGHDDSFVARIDQQNYIVERAKSSVTGWQLLCAIPEASVLEPIRQMQEILVIVLLAATLLIVLVALRCSHVIIRPIRALTHAIEEIDYEKMTLDEVLVNEDEIGRLARRFYEMFLRLQQLLKQREHDNRLLKDAELRTLQSQINPHFLYNTLDNVIWLAKAHNEPEIEAMMLALARFYRISLSQGADEIPFSLELEHVKCYLAIELMRGSPQRFAVEYAIDPRAMRVKVIKTILQPLVENAIKHGFSGKQTPGHLIIKAQVEDEMLIVHVIDDGVGMPDVALTVGIVSGQQYGYGIGNVNARLMHQYGKSHALRFAVTPGGGTTAIILIPLKGEAR